MNEGFEQKNTPKSAYDAMAEQFGAERIDPESMHAFIKVYQAKEDLTEVDKAELANKMHVLEDFSTRLKEKGENVPEYIEDSVDKIQALLSGIILEEVSEDDVEKIEWPKAA